jgi:hypothetical protein
MQGCTTSVATLSLASIDEAEDWPLLVLEPRVEGKACRSALLRVIPLGNPEPPLHAAIAEAVGRTPDAQLLTKVQVDLQTIDILVYTRQCIRVRGTAARRARTVHIH